MAYYVKKPIQIEAFRYGYEEPPSWFIEAQSIDNNSSMKNVIHTLEGDMHISHGDYVIKGVHGELYPCKPDIFEETYSPFTQIY